MTYEQIKEDYANNLCLPKSKIKTDIKSNKQYTNNITINNTNTLTSNANIDIAIKNLIERLEEDCLSKEQEIELKEKI